jgi:hypothetical protein
VKPTDLAWLAGILDGEGAVYIGRSFQKMRPIYKPDVRVEMVDERTIDRVCWIYKKLDVDFTKKSLPMKNPKHRPRHIVWMKGHESVLKLCRAVAPYLVTKVAHAKLVAQFCTLRLKVNHRGRRDAKGRMIRTYTGAEEPIYTRLRLLNKRGT